jgi:GH15 family glucan-1,4-alpha-glucosidase
MPYQDIGSYGVIGDLHSVALVGMDGSIDWCCLPNFDSPSVFAAMLDDQKGGFFRIAPVAEARQRQMYFPETNVLLTRFLNADGVAEITDFMTIDRRSAVRVRHEIVRQVRAIRGQMPFRLECRPAFDYARAGHRLTVRPARALFTAPGIRLTLAATHPLTRHGGAVVCGFTLRAGECATFILRQHEDGAAPIEDPAAFGEAALRETLAYWKRWVSHCGYRGRWREMVVRSALALKLLTFAPTGAIVAAPTCSLPEVAGGVRNWDYRYTWIRDAAFTIRAFLLLGYTEEATAFMNWLQLRTREHESGGPLQPMYGIDGRHDLPEIVLDHLDGYRGSRPVRIGNAASRQLQLDIYGELVDSIYLYNKHVSPVSYDSWLYLRRMLDWVWRNWKRKDHGIWESRQGPEHFVYSKMQCWVALERGLRIARHGGLPIDGHAIRLASAEIYEAIMRKGWSEERQSFVQYFGSDAVDATALLMPLMLFVSATDPRMRSTLARVQRELVTDGLVLRYEVGRATGDGLPGKEGTFSICTFWLVDALAKMGRLSEARLVFEKMLTYANHLGLYAEEIGPSGEAMGNFPQAFTHLGLINAACALDHSHGAGARPGLFRA